MLHWYTEITRTHHLAREMRPPSPSGLQRPRSARVNEVVSWGGGLHPRTLKAQSSCWVENSRWKSPSGHPVRRSPPSWTRGVTWCGCNAPLASDATRKMMQNLIRPPPPPTQFRRVTMLCAARWVRRPHPSYCTLFPLVWSLYISSSLISLSKTPQHLIEVAHRYFKTVLLNKDMDIV